MDSKLVQHLARCDASALIGQLGEETHALLKKVGEGAAVPRGLAELTVHVYGEEGVLKSSALRQLLFDQLSVEEGERLCDVLNLPSAAPALTLGGVAFDNDEGNASLLRRFFNVSVDEPSLPLEATQNAAAAHQLRTHQAEAYRKLRRMIGNPNASVLVHMPFGAGKLRTVATAILDLYRSEPDGRIVVWLASGEALAEEVFAELNKVWLQLGSRNVTSYRLYGSHPMPDLANIENGLVVADIARIGERHQGLSDLARRTRVLVLGDAESLRHCEVSNLLDVMNQDSECALIGISASPAETIQKLSAVTPISKRFGGNIISVEDDDPIALFRSAGDIDEIAVRIEAIPGLSIKDLSRAGLEIDRNALVALSQDVNRNYAIIEFVLREALLVSDSVVVFCASAEQTRLFAGLFMLRGARATAISGDMTESQKHMAIQRYVARLDKILCVHGWFITGSEFPQTSLAVMAVPIISSSVLNEFIGRLASGRNKPKDPLQVVLLADAVPDYLALAEGIGKWDALKIQEL